MKALIRRFIELLVEDLAGWCAERIGEVLDEWFGVERDDEDEDDDGGEP